ncbi:MAG: uracil-DNA glycosylase [Propionibacteriaceae bacterium]|nr:uracil-DNA glycosylase [Propionibacteriaceae bacterium]
MSLPHPLTGQGFASPVPPGSGWPDDPGAPTTPVARTPAEVVRLADSSNLAELDARVSVCRACPRLVAWREDVARDKRASFAGEPYWGRPIAGWGDPEAWLVVLGLAPAAHGGNRTGRVFTGDRSGDWLFAALHRAGLAELPTSVHSGDGQRLTGARIVAAVRCAPPANRPTTTERDTCAPWLAAELALLPNARVVLCLGGFAWDAALRQLAAAGAPVPRPRPGFGHGAVATVGGLALLGSYHPSQQNTFTGKLTVQMLDDVFATARELAGRGTR